MGDDELRSDWIPWQGSLGVMPVTVEVSPELLARLTGEWSVPVQLQIEHLENARYRMVARSHDCGEYVGQHHALEQLRHMVLDTDQAGIGPVESEVLRQKARGCGPPDHA